MVTVIADGEVRIHRQENDNYTDGRDRISISAGSLRTEDINIELEMPDGHVNLEGYAGSVTDWPISDTFDREIDMALGDVDGYRTDVDEGTWEVRIVGNTNAWLTQAVRYLQERPNRSLTGCLWYFESWDETNDNSLHRAVQEVEGLENAQTEQSELTRREHAELIGKVAEMAPRVEPVDPQELNADFFADG